jgi:hypothetical protein
MNANACCTVKKLNGLCILIVHQETVHITAKLNSNNQNNSKENQIVNEMNLFEECIQSCFHKRWLKVLIEKGLQAAETVILMCCTNMSFLCSRF